MSSPTVSVVILNTNDLPFLQTCLSSVLRTKYDNFEVIFVDNNSYDASLQLVKTNFSEYPRLRVVRNPANFGYAKGNNVGAKLSTADYIAFLNPDTEVDPRWLKEIVSVMSTDETIGACQPKLLLQKMRNRFDVIGSYFTPFGFLYHEGHLGPDRGQFSEKMEIFAAKGACLVARRELFERVGRFDEDYWTFFEDSDLSWKIWLNGGRVMYVPTSIVYHEAGGSFSRKMSPQVTRMRAFLGFRNRLLCLITNLGSANLLRVVPLHIALCIGLAMWLRLKGRSLEAASILLSIQWTLFNWKLVYRKRREIQLRIRKVPDKKIMSRVMKKVSIIELYRILGNYMKITQG
jgi:GT2 family glycosyltransferase